MRNKFDNIWLGMATGILGALIGFVIFGIGFTIATDTSFSQFFNDWFLVVHDWQSRIVTFSVLVDVVLFYICVKKDMYNFGKGLMVVLVLSVLAVSWLEFR